MASNPTISELKKRLGDDYQICDIDLERCLYRDFSNGFNVEISGVSRAKLNGSATLYLWFGTELPDCLIVKTVKGIGRTAKAIGAAVNELHELSQQLIACGCADRRSLLEWKQNL